MDKHTESRVSMQDFWYYTLVCLTPMLFPLQQSNRAPLLGKISEMN